MTAIRKSVVFAPEYEFGKGVPDMVALGVEETQPTSSSYQYKYSQFPPGTFLSHTGARQASSVYTTGSKRRAGTVYGNFSGTWNISFPLDYNYLEPLAMIYETIDESGDDSNDPFAIFTTLDDDDSGTVDIYPEGSTLRYFRKTNAGRVKSFVMREKILNRMAGGQGGVDEVTILKGCVAKSFNISRSASGSQANIEISGIYSDQETKLGYLSATDYDMAATMDGTTQYSCMFVDGIADGNYVGDVDSHSFSIDNNANLVFNTCTPIAKQYYEGQTNYSWNAQTYSNDPVRKFQLRPNSGGKLLSGTVAQASNLAMQPLGKGLGPMTWATWATYSTSCRDSDEQIDSYVEAIQKSAQSFIACAKNSTVKSMTWQKGDGSKMMDSLSSVECDEIRLRVVNTNDGFWIHLTTSADPSLTQA